MTLASPAALLTRSEAEELRACDNLIAQLGGEIVRLEQRRPSHVALGLPDRRYRLQGVAWWHEGKATGGKLSEHQLDFLTREHACGEIVCVGGVSELYALVMAIRQQPREVARALGYATLTRYSRQVSRGDKEMAP